MIRLLLFLGGMCIGFLACYLLFIGIMTKGFKDWSLW